MRAEDEIYEKIKVPDGLEARLEALIDNLADAEKLSKRKAKQMRLWMAGAAASIALFVSIGLHHLPENKSPDTMAQIGTNIDPEIACMEAQKALLLVSLNFNKGLNQLAMVSQELDKSNQILNKTFKK